MQVSITRAAVAAMLMASLLSACSGAGLSTNPDNSQALTIRRAVDPADYGWTANWGPINKTATATCPSGWSAIDGGTNDTDGYPIGTGQLNETKNGWIAPADPDSNAQSEAFVSCVSPSVASNFQWVHAAHAGAVAAPCPSGWSLVGGFGYGSVAAEFPVYGTVNEWVVSSGSASISAHASCAKDGLGLVVQPAVGTGSAIAGCESGRSGYIIIGGSTGDKDYPGPPRYNYPLGTTGPTGGNTWHISGTNLSESVKAYAVCAPT